MELYNKTKNKVTFISLHSLSMPPRSAVRFKKEMKSLISDLYHALIKAFESDEYADRKGKIINSFETSQANILGKISEHAEKESFMVKQTPSSIITIPLKDNKPLTEVELKNMTEAEIDEMNKRQDK